MACSSDRVADAKPGPEDASVASRRLAGRRRRPRVRDSWTRSGAARSARTRGTRARSHVFFGKICISENTWRMVTDRIFPVFFPLHVTEIHKTPDCRSLWAPEAPTYDLFQHIGACCLVVIEVIYLIYNSQNYPIRAYLKLVSKFFFRGAPPPGPPKRTQPPAASVLRTQTRPSVAELFAIFSI